MTDSTSTSGADAPAALEERTDGPLAEATEPDSRDDGVDARQALEREQPGQAVLRFDDAVARGREHRDLMAPGDVEFGEAVQQEHEGAVFRTVDDRLEIATGGVQQRHVDIVSPAAPSARPR